MAQAADKTFSRVNHSVLWGSYNSSVQLQFLHSVECEKIGKTCLRFFLVVVAKWLQSAFLWSRLVTSISFDPTCGVIWPKNLLGITWMPLKKKKKVQTRIMCDVSKSPETSVQWASAATEWDEGWGEVQYCSTESFVEQFCKSMTLWGLFFSQL